MQEIIVEKSNKYVTKREREREREEADNHVGGYGDR